MISNKGLTNPRSTPEEEGEAVEEEASPEDMIRDVNMGYQGNRGGYQQGYQNPHHGGYRGKQCGGKFDKSPTKRNPRVNSKTKDADKDHCRYCREIGHWGKRMSSEEER